MCLQEGSISPEIYTDTEESGSESEEATDDDEYYEDDEYGDATHESDAEAGDNLENASGETCSESGDPGDYDLCDDQVCLCTFLHEHPIYLHALIVVKG